MNHSRVAASLGIGLRGGATFLGALSLLVLPSCAMQTAPEAEAEAEGETQTKTQSIQHGSVVPDGWDLRRYIVAVPGCTGTIISRGHVLTAAHCDSVTVGSPVFFYTAGSSNPVWGANVAKVYMPNGVSHTDKKDTNGDWADYQVLSLDRVIPPEARIALMATEYIGRGQEFVQIGAGLHDDNSNPNLTLRWRYNETYSRKAHKNGRFDSVTHRTNDGDSGGPAITMSSSDAGIFYQVNGTVIGRVWKDGRNRTRYTAVAPHFSKIKKFLGVQVQNNTSFTGPTVGSARNVSEPDCQALMIQNAEATSYDWYLNGVDTYHGYCTLYGSGRPITASGKRGGWMNWTGECNLGSDGICRG